MKLQNLPFVFMLLLFILITGEAQVPAVVSIELEHILDKADKATRHYTETFKNLSADEIKIIEDYEKGKLKEKRRTKSTFIVYQSATDDSVNEFRMVTEFNGANITQSDTEIEKLFEKLAYAGSTTNERKILKMSALRFDGKSSAWGMTLWQESPFGKLKPFFEFTIVGKDRIEGRDTLVIEYRQTKPTLLLKFNPTEKDWRKEPDGREYNASVSSSLRPTNARQQGKIWLDMKTAQIWRNELQIFLQPPQLSQPVLGLELSYEYQPSKFEVLVPKKFACVFYKISGSGNKNLSVVKDRTMVFDYSKFSKFKTEAKSYKIDEKK